MTTLITGATGFIGSRLARRLANEGESVRVLCRPTADVSALNDPNIRIVLGDVLDSAGLGKALAGCDRVFHLAAYAKNWAKDPTTFIDVNVGGLKRLLSAALQASVKKVVFTSSALTLGPSNGQPVSESSVRSAEFFTDYERSKFIAEQEVQQYVHAGLDVVIVNPTRVFGPGPLTEGNSATRMIQWYVEGKLQPILGDGSLLGNYAYVEDVVRGHVLAMQRGRAGERYTFGGENVSFTEFFRLISEISGKRHRAFHIPPPLALAIAYAEKLRAEWFNHHPLITPGWVRTFLVDWACSTVKAERELGYAVTPLRTALESTISWLEQQRVATRGKS